MVMRFISLITLILLAACNTEQPSYKPNPSVNLAQISWQKTDIGDTLVYTADFVIKENPWVVLSKRNCGFKLFLDDKLVAQKEVNVIKTNDYYTQPAIGIYSQWENVQTWIDAITPGAYELKLHVWGNTEEAPLIATKYGDGASKSVKPDVIFEQASNMPVVYINTNGEVIPDEPKVPAEVSWVSANQFLIHKEGAVNIALERRGNTSQHFAKKAYAINVAHPVTDFIGLPSAKKYILYAPYADKSLVRNTLVYSIANKTNTNAVKYKYCELVVNGDYQGIYVLMHRMDDLQNLGIDSNSAIIKFDRGNPNCQFLTKPSTYPKKRETRFEIIRPSLLEEQDSISIVHSLQEFEKSIDNYELDSDEFLKHIDILSFVDYFILNEWSKNIDAYRLSAYFNYNRSSNKWQAGPIWDYNFAFGLVDYEDGYSPEGFVYDTYDEIPFWWEKLAFNRVFQKAVKSRWLELRNGILSDENVNQFIGDLLRDEDAVDRNFKRWKLLDQKEVWPNYYLGKTHQNELEYLKNWIKQRSIWLDNNWFEKESQILVEVRTKKAEISADTAWLNTIKGKAEKNNITVDSQLEKDAWWVVYNR